MNAKRLRAVIVPLVLLLPLGGCVGMRGFAYLTAPPQIQKPEVELTNQRLAVLIDYARPADANPVFENALIKRMVELFQEKKLATQVVPFEELLDLRQERSDWARMSVQNIGREVGAAQVLGVRVERLRVQETPDVPLLSPEVELRIKLVVADAPAAKARLWPDRDKEPEGRFVRHNRPPREGESPEAIDAETVRLARETAYYVARYFYKYDAEEFPPREK